MPLLSNCSVCEKSLNPSDKEIYCDKCRSPVHTTCSGLSRAEVSLLNASDKKRLSFHCDFCTKEKKTIAELQELIKNLKHDIEELKQKTAAPSIENLPSEFVETVVSEINERNKRSSNIIIFNVDEPASESREIRITHDTNKVIEVINSITQVNTDTLHVIRLGKAVVSRNRPIKVIFRSEVEAKEVLKNKSRLPSNSRIRISSDQTPMQRKHLTELRKSLEERQNRGESDLTIKYVNGIPKIIPKPKN